MTRLIAANGVLACEESVVDSRVSYPRYNCVHTLFTWIGKMLTAKGCDVEIGAHLFHMMHQFSAFKSEMQFSQLVITDVEEIKDYLDRMKTLLTSIKPALLEFNFVTEQQIDHLFQDIKSAQPKSGDFIAHDRMTQLWATRCF